MDKEELASNFEIQQILGVSRQTVYSLSKKESFPKPMFAISTARIWLADDVKAWRDSGVWNRRNTKPEVLNLVPVYRGRTLKIDLVAPYMIARQLRVTTSRVTQLRQKSDFPDPYATLFIATFYLRSDIEAYAKHRLSYIDLLDEEEEL